MLRIIPVDHGWYFAWTQHLRVGLRPVATPTGPSGQRRFRRRYVLRLNLFHLKGIATSSRHERRISKARHDRVQLPERNNITISSVVTAICAFHITLECLKQQKSALRPRKVKNRGVFLRLPDQSRMWRHRSLLLWWAPESGMPIRARGARHQECPL
jgi:hypothetical protein